MYIRRVTPRCFIATFAQFAETPGHRNEESANSCLEKEGETAGYSRLRYHLTPCKRNVQSRDAARASRRELHYARVSSNVCYGVLEKHSSS